MVVEGVGGAAVQKGQPLAIYTVRNDKIQDSILVKVYGVELRGVESSGPSGSEGVGIYDDWDRIARFIHLRMNILESSPQQEYKNGLAQSHRRCIFIP